MDSVYTLFVLNLVLMALWQASALLVSLVDSYAVAMGGYRFMAIVASGQFVLYFAFVRAFLHLTGYRRVLVGGIAAWVAIVIASVVNPDLFFHGLEWNEELGYYLPHFGPGTYFQGVLSYFFLGFTVFLLVRGARRAGDTLEGRRIRYLLLGLSLVVVGSLFNFVPAMIQYPIDIAANLANALIIAYAILRYQLLDITVVVRKGMLYSIPTAIIGAGYFLVVLLAVNLFQLVTGYQVLVLSLIMAAITAVAVQPLWHRMQSWVDRLFFHEKWDASRMLQRLSRTAASVLDLDSLTRMILDELAATIHIERAALFLRLEETGRFRLAAQRGLGQHVTMQLREDHPLILWLSEHRSILARSHADTLPQYRALWIQEREDLDQMEADLFVPLLVRDELIGILVLGPKRLEIPYTQDERLTLTTLANQTAVAVQNAWLFSLEQRKAEESSALLEIAQAVSSTLELTRLLEIIARRTAQVCGVDRCSILLLDDEVGRLIPLMSQFAHGRSDTELWRTFKEHTYVEDVERIPLIRQVLTKQKPVIIDERSMSMLSAVWIEPFGIKSLLAVPLISKDEVIGLMALDHIAEGQRFSEEQLNLATTIATQATIAIENARLYEETIEEKERTETIVEQAFSGIMVIDPAQQVVTVNPEVETMTGYTSHELLGSQLQELFGPELWGEGSLLSEVMASGERTTPTEATIVGKDRLCDVLLGVTPIREGYLLNFADVTRLKEVDRLKSSIVANVSHELRAPLASIKAYTELLLDKLEGDDKLVRHRFLTIIDQEADWLTELINGLLDLSRLEAERYAARMNHLSVTEVIEGVITLLEVQISKQRVDVCVDLAPDLPLVVGDKELMTIVVKNLISNAVKFSAEGGRVDVGARVNENALVLEVRDQGMGIPKEDLPLLFTKFYRSEIVREAGIRGTGLGLVLAKEAVEMHEGSIDVESELGVGTRFLVTLPLSVNGEKA
jgi:PAS domain S-box-containing protein